MASEFNILNALNNNNHFVFDAEDIDWSLDGEDITHEELVKALESGKDFDTITIRLSTTQGDFHANGGTVDYLFDFNFEIEKNYHDDGKSSTYKIFFYSNMEPTSYPEIDEENDNNEKYQKTVQKYMNQLIKSGYKFVNTDYFYWDHNYDGYFCPAHEKNLDTLQDTIKHLSDYLIDLFRLIDGKAAMYNCLTEHYGFNT